jgi:RimJ/RimL family protein N-acetyltransferase
MLDLYAPLTDGIVALEPLAEQHREGLRAACAADTAIWDLYPFSFLGDAFDRQFDAMLGRERPRLAYAIRHDDAIIGMTAWIDLGTPGWAVEIGNSYIIPAARGTGINDRLKRLMLDHAFAHGYRRVVFKVDALNARSQAAVLKLGCTREGLMRAERQTWTGRVRDTVMFAILAEEWAARGASALVQDGAA